MRAVLVVLVLAALFGGGAARGEQLVDGIAAQVGSNVVLISDVREAAAPTEARARAQGATDDDIRQLYFEVLEQMIERQLIRQVVQRAEIGATDAEVDDAIAKIASENKLSPEKLRASVEAQGMPYALYRERIRSEIEHARVINDLVASKTHVDDKELREIYDKEMAKQPAGGDEYLLRVIVVPPKTDQPGAREAACSEVDAAKARLAGGEKFEGVAREVSASDPDAGVSQAWVHESEVAGWMRAVVQSLPVGAVSDRIDVGSGCGIVQVGDKRSFVPKTFEQAKDGLRRQLFDERLQAEYKKLIDRLRAQTYIERKGIFGDTGIQRSSAVAKPPGAEEPGF
jgi:peptidyl-prolyl cis-trans isomerase SurA